MAITTGDNINSSDFKENKSSAKIGGGIKLDNNKEFDGRMVRHGTNEEEISKNATPRKIQNGNEVYKISSVSGSTIIATGFRNTPKRNPRSSEFEIYDIDGNMVTNARNSFRYSSSTGEYSYRFNSIGSGTLVSQDRSVSGLIVGVRDVPVQETRGLTTEMHNVLLSSEFLYSASGGTLEMLDVSDNTFFSEMAGRTATNPTPSFTLVSKTLTNGEVFDFELHPKAKIVHINGLGAYDGGGRVSNSQTSLGNLISLKSGDPDDANTRYPDRLEALRSVGILGGVSSLATASTVSFSDSHNDDVTYNRFSLTVPVNMFPATTSINRDGSFYNFYARRISASKRRQFDGTDLGDTGNLIECYTRLDNRDRGLYWVRQYG